MPTASVSWRLDALAVGFVRPTTVGFIRPTTVEATPSLGRCCVWYCVLCCACREDSSQVRSRSPSIGGCFRFGPAALYYCLGAFLCRLPNEMVDVRFGKVPASTFTEIVHMMSVDSMKKMASAGGRMRHMYRCCRSLLSQLACTHGRHHTYR